MNHQVGDTITIADYDTICARTVEAKYNRQLADGHGNTAYFTPEMQRYCNQTFIVKAVNKYGYELVGTNFTFSDYMLTSFETIDVTQPYKYW